MRQSGVLAAAGLYAIENNFERMQDDHRRASAIAQFLKTLPSIDLDLESVQTNIIIFGFTDPKVNLDAILADMKAKGLLVSKGTKGKLRIVTHLDISDSDVDNSIEILSEVLKPKN